MTIPRSPLLSLQEGCWFKLICGASYHHLPAIRNLALAYTLAGADCIDLAADPAIVTAAASGVKTALQLASQNSPHSPGMPERPWLMISLNDGEDPHFRKAAFDPARCPPGCSRPCEQICPAQAISFEGPVNQWGIAESRCYGCGRCLPICPYGQINARSHYAAPAAIAAQLFSIIDAVEIHTQVGHQQEFEQLWHAIQPWIAQLKLIAISCTEGEGVIDYLWHLWKTMSPLPLPLLWQTDGRSMSGDIGRGTTTAAIRFSRQVLQTGPPGYVQLAGGTNGSTVQKLKALGLLQSSPGQLAQTPTLSCRASYISGVAYGSYARKLLMDTLTALEAETLEAGNTGGTGLQALSQTKFDRLKEFPPSSLLDVADLDRLPHLLAVAVQRATSLVGQIKIEVGRLNSASASLEGNAQSTFPP